MLPRFLFLAILSLALVAACGDDDEEVPDEETTATAPDERVEPTERRTDASTPEPTATQLLATAPASPPEVEGETITTESGLQYIDIVVGTGISPMATSAVSVHYTGWLAEDGTKFDSSVDRGMPATFQVNGLIEGFSEGLLTMKTGGKRRLIIPPDLAYGEQGSPPAVPPNATLIFDVELLVVV